MFRWIFLLNFCWLIFFNPPWLFNQGGSDRGGGQKLNRCVGAGKRKGAHLMLTQSTAKRIFWMENMG